MGRKKNTTPAGPCIACHKWPGVCRGKTLCSNCYIKVQREEYKKKHGINEPYFVPVTQQKIENAAEINFIKHFFTHKNWIYHPATFRCNSTNYQPDFYDGERNIFIEVTGTRQAYHFNKDKYKLFRETFPAINFEIRKADGTLIDETGRIEWDKEVGSNVA